MGHHGCRARRLAHVCVCVCVHVHVRDVYSMTSNATSPEALMLSGPVAVTSMR